MAIKLLRRKVIIREHDFNKVEAKSRHLSLYDRMSFTPLNQDSLEKLKLQEILRGKTGPLAAIDTDLKMPAVLVAQLQDFLYDKKYHQWTVSIDEEGYLCVQSRKNTPRTRLGWGIFEKDIERHYE
jgi:hypothetical protein